MKDTPKLVLVVLVLAAAPSFAAGGEKPTQAAADTPSGRLVKLVDIDGEGRDRKSVLFAAASQSECKCSEWRKVTTEECVAWDNQGNCSKKQTVTKKECIAWDHCH